MFFDPEIVPSSLQLILLGLGSYLFIFSMQSLIRFRNSPKLVLFSISVLCLSLVQLSQLFGRDVIIAEVLSILIWPCFYIFASHQTKPIKFQWSLLLHLLIPGSWLILHHSIFFSGATKTYPILYLLIVTGYSWMSIVALVRFKKMKMQDKSATSYFSILVYGLLLLLLIRFLLPLFSQNETTALSFFHMLVGFYFITTSSFLLQIPSFLLPENARMELHDNLENYEEQMKRKLRKVMGEERAYLNPDLNLQELSELLKIKPVELSSFINSSLEKNFNDFVNEYRVEEIKRLIADPTKDDQVTIIELAYQAGFNSKASFNRVFKELTGMTPSEYKKSTII